MPRTPVDKIQLARSFQEAVAPRTRPLSDPRRAAFERASADLVEGLVAINVECGLDRANGRRMRVRQGKRTVAEESSVVVARALLAEVDRFWTAFPLSMSDACCGDLLQARARLLAVTNA